MNAEILYGYPMREYLADRGHLSGHVLKWCDKNPERFGEWTRGTVVDHATDAMNQGIFFNDRLLEPDEVSRRYAFLPSRAEACEPVMVPKIGVKGHMKGKPLKTLVPKLDDFGNPVLEPQDASPRGQGLSMLRQSAYAKDVYAAFIKNALRERMTVITPEQQTTVDAMIRAVRAHPVARQLLSRGKAEATIRWTCPVTGELLQSRPDWLDPDFVDDHGNQAPLWLEVKTVAPKSDRDRLDTLDPAQVGRWIRDGWGIKSAMAHDGITAAFGDSVGAWIVVEATDRDPRVSVAWDYKELGGGLYTIGRDGVCDPETKRTIHRGYLELVQLAAALRVSNDFRHDCTKGALDSFPIPRHLLYAMEAADHEPAVQLKGARVVANG
jgi:hypothetical protein